MQSELLTPDEAAVYLRLNPQTTYRLLRGGQLPGVKVGRQWRIRKSTLDAYLNGQLPSPIHADSDQPSS
jgi:excisionase family DNA binding protein